jgi:hypothetical protein
MTTIVEAVRTGLDARQVRQTVSSYRSLYQGVKQTPWLRAPRPPRGQRTAPATSTMGR